MIDGIHYANGRPSYTGDTVVRCFAGSHNGLLFRIVNSDEYRWAFYNDTTSYHITVRVSFGGLSKVEPLGRTVMHRNRAATTFDFEVLVAPGATEMFMEGEPNGFQISYVAQRYSRKLKTLLEPVVVEAPPPPPPAYHDACLSGSEDDARGVPRRASSDVIYSPAASVGF